MRVSCPHCGAPVRELPYPPCTVDAVIEPSPGHVVLVHRRFEPLGWALPGGFVEVGETLEAACKREVAEETGLQIEGMRQLHTYSDPARDPRHHTITTVFVGRAIGTPRAGDDAERVGVFSFDTLPHPLCFDHRSILEDFRTGRWGISPNLT